MGPIPLSLIANTTPLAHSPGGVSATHEVIASRWKGGMTNSVERCDAREFRHDILSLFDRNGAQIPSEQFDWYYGQSADDKVVSWVLRGSDLAVVGLCSVVPRTFRFGRRLVRAGVVGNFMVDKESRVIGGIALLRSVQSLVTHEPFDVLLGLP